MTDRGTDQRLDELSKRVDHGFAQTDGRLDELSKRMDFGFEQANERLGRAEGDIRELRADMNKGFDRVDARFERVDERFGKVDDEFKSVRAEMKDGFESMQRQMTRFFAGTLGTVVAGVIVTVVTVLAHS
jgi:tetrahydromethanopterin S-methyltransferase subunit G